MIRDFNLLVTTARGHEFDVCSEIWYLLTQIGDDSPRIDKTGVSGLISVRTAIPPQEAIRKLRGLLKGRPREFQFTLRVIPIQTVTETTLDSIKKAATELAGQIGIGETFRVTVEKRFSNLPTKEITDVAASEIHRTVNLTNPEKILLVEVVGKLTGMSIIEPGGILSTSKERLVI
jgi:tRNA acetyltransferase TAN1